MRLPQLANLIMDDAQEKARRAFNSPGSGYEAGFGKTVTERVEQQAAAAKRREATECAKRMQDLSEVTDDDGSRRSRRLPGDTGTVSEPPGELLPKEFFIEAMARVEVHLRVGGWPMAKRAIDEIERQWLVLQQEATPWHQRPLGERLSMHVSGLLPVRIVNSIESVMPATLGAILEGWPDSFVGLPNFGTRCLEAIGQRLVEFGLLTRGQYSAGVDRYWELSNKRGRANLRPQRREV